MARHFILVCFLLTILLINVRLVRSEGNMTTLYVGTVLFAQSDLNRDCWSADNVALITSRMIIKNILPRVDTLKANDDKFVTDIIDYFRLILEVVRKTTSGKIKHIMLLALTDVLGGYMRHLVLPIAKYAYYAGNVDYASVIKLYQLYDEIKNYLRTNGAGWAMASKKVGRHIMANAISLQGSAPSTDPCIGGHAARTAQAPPASASSCGMEVPLPFFDSKSHPSAIAVPFKTYGLRNLESRVSAYILVKFYVAVSKCMQSRNTKEEDVAAFNVNLFGFIMSKVMPHLCDDKFYSAFGGVLRILETIKQSGFAKKGNVMGNFNIIPEMEDREPDADADSKGAGMIGAGGGGGGEPSNKKKNNLILIAALATILIWFLLGAVFVCCRIRVQKMKKEEQLRALNGGPGSSTQVGAGSTKGSSAKGSSGKSGKSKSKSKSSKSKSTKSTPGTDSEGVCNDETCPAFGTSGGSTTAEKSNMGLGSVNVYTTTKRASSKVLRSISDSSKSTTRTNTTEGDSETNLAKPPELRVQSVQYYPPSFACHTSMTGKIKMDSSTDDYTSRDETKRPYVFGYDFQTTSEESSPRETTDGENEMGGNMSK